jgi:hypothetical protein
MNRNLALWIAVLGGPLVWLCTFEAIFALAPWACTFQSKLVLYLVTCAGLVVCAGCAMLAWTQWKSLGQQQSSSDGGALPRSNFMAIGGVVLSAGCFMILLAQAIPEVILGACE